MTEIHFGFTFECPRCGILIEKNHLEFEVLFTGTKLGKCPQCQSMITLHLTTSEEQPDEIAAALNGK